MQVVEALFYSHHSRVHEHQEVVHSLCIPEEKGVYGSLALQQGDNHIGHHEEGVSEETLHETGADLEGGVSGNPAVVCDQLREGHNGGDVGVDCKALLSKSNEDMMRQTHIPVLLEHSLKVDEPL